MTRFAVAASSPAPNPDLLAYRTRDTGARRKYCPVKGGLLRAAGTRDVHRASPTEHAARFERLHQTDQSAGTRKRSPWIASTRCTMRSRAVIRRARSSTISTTADRFSRRKSRKTGSIAHHATSSFPMPTCASFATPLRLARRGTGQHHAAAAANHADAYNPAPFPNLPPGKPPEPPPQRPPQAR